MTRSASAASAGLTLRPITEEEFPTWARAAESAFYNDPVSDEHVERFRSVIELPRTLAAFDDDRMVGASALLTTLLTVPGGGSVGMAGLTAVGVAPTHRRQGMLTALMRRHFDDIAEGPEPISGLYAAEAPIYGRFGYGPATTAHHWTIEQAHSAFRPEVPVERGVTFADLDEALRDFPAIYDRVRSVRPGFPDRNAAAWRARFAWDPEDEREGHSRRYLVRLGDRGYVSYRASDVFEQNVPRGTAKVEEHMAVDAAAAATLWRFVLDLDLVATIHIRQRPPDDLLPLFLADPRRLQGWQSDALWLRLMAVGPGLSSRAYSVAGSVVFAVHDRHVPANTGRWRLETADDDAQCTPTTDDADLSVDVAHLGAAFLGDRRFSRLLRAGLIEEHSAGAAGRADRMFFTEPQGWCPQEF